MVQRYVWWDEIVKHERVRTELRLPRPLHEMLIQVAKENSVSLNGLTTGILSYAVDPQRRRRLRVEVVPSVRVTEAGPADQPIHVPVPPSSEGRVYGYGKGTVR